MSHLVDDFRDFIDYKERDDVIMYISCYNCIHESVCGLNLTISKILEKKVYVRHLHDRSNFLNSLAKYCKYYEMCKEEGRE